MNKGGRPSIYSGELADLICERIIEGVSMRTICKADDMPAISTVFKWIRENPEFSQQYAKAKEEQADTLVEDMLLIPDEEEDVQRARLKVDVRKWAASKLKAKKYGDSTQIKHADADGNKIEGLDIGFLAPKDNNS